MFLIFKNRPRLKGIARTVYQQLKEKLEFLPFCVTGFYQPLKESVYLGFVGDILPARLILLKVETCLQISLLYCADVFMSFIRCALSESIGLPVDLVVY